MSQLITPPHVTRTVISAESKNTSDNFHDASTVLDESGSLGPFLDATLAKSRQLKNAETPNENPTTPVNSLEPKDYTCGN